MLYVRVARENLEFGSESWEADETCAAVAADMAIAGMPCKTASAAAPLSISREYLLHNLCTFLAYTVPDPMIEGPRLSGNMAR